ncbi:unnamed protein product [Dibothriocephalus latus]|uniref:Uncharacterized protein n=1 Tax=Dibothriocephalus latus TaxID=60516 RepID=A0A3P7MKR4_DIBLA|nr:unnamed protein product [Dibothriocephalus latus]
MTSNLKMDGQQSFDNWVAGIDLRRSEDAAKSVADFGFATCRVRLLSGNNKFVTFPDSASGAKQLDASEAASLKSGADSSSVLYWMNRDQRVQGKIFLHLFLLPSFECLIMKTQIHYSK